MAYGGGVGGVEEVEVCFFSRRHDDGEWFGVLQVGKLNNERREIAGLEIRRFGALRDCRAGC